MIFANISLIYSSYITFKAAAKYFAAAKEDKMKAIILAGGEGKRLRPITEKMPKPLVPIGGTPIIRLILKKLYDAGVREAAVTTGYLSDMLVSYLGDECCGIKIRCFKEETPLGTAGGILPCREFIGNEPFIVMSGDALCCIDIKKAIEKRGTEDADAVLLLTHCDSPGEYGIVLTDSEGCVSGFYEKPSVMSSFSDTVNTGIYVLSPRIFDLIPKDRPYDFGSELFPQMLRTGRSLFAVCGRGYWCDIGDPDAYYRANMRASGNKSIIPQSSYTDGSIIRSSVLMDDCTVKNGSVIENSVLCKGVKIGKNVLIKGSFIGEGAIIGDGAVLAEGTKLSAGSTVNRTDSEKAKARSRDIIPELLCGRGFVLKKSELVRFDGMLFGEILSSSIKGNLGVMTDGRDSSEALAAEIMLGASYHGCHVLDLGDGFEISASLAASTLPLTLTFFVRETEDDIFICLFDENGIYPKREVERRLIHALWDRAATPKESSSIVFGEDFTHSSYFREIKKHCRDLHGFSFSVKRENDPSRLLSDVLVSCGAKLSDDGVCLSVSDDGYEITALQDGYVASDSEIKAVLLRFVITEETALPITHPIFFTDLFGSRLKRYSTCPSGNGEDSVRALCKSSYAIRHGCICGVLLASLLHSTKKSLYELCSWLPKYSIKTADIRLLGGHHLSILPVLGRPDGDGVMSEYQHGSVRVIPTNFGYRLISEAAASEYASEILELSEKEIKRLIENDKMNTGHSEPADLV